MADADRLLTGIRALVRRFAISERADVSVCGMTVAQSATLEALGAAGPADGAAIRSGDLGRRLGISASTLSRNLDRLEERGLVVRRPDERDARAMVVALTAKGRRAAAEVRQCERDFAESILRHVPPGARADVIENLERLLVAVREATESCCPGAFDHLMRDFPARCGPRCKE